MCSLKVGFDLDNTIIDYSQSFEEALKSILSINLKNFSDKEEIKREVLKMDNGSSRWEELQSKVYSMRVGDQRLFKGVVQCLKDFKNAGISLCIVSHKTEKSKFDKSISLRPPAFSFLKKCGVIGDKENHILPASSLFFESTPEEKAMRIQKEEIDFFIDDNQSFFEIAQWPEATRGIHFGSGSEKALASWEDLCETVSLFKKINLESLRQFIELVDDFPLKTQRINEDGNNYNLKVRGLKSTYLVKTTTASHEGYLKHEYKTMQALMELEVKCIPNCLAMGYDLFIYEYIEPINSLDEKTFFYESELFLKKLLSLKYKRKWSFAKDHRECLNDYFSLLETRLEKIKTGILSYSTSARDWFVLEFEPFYKEVTFAKREIVKQRGIDLYERFPRDSMILSPSDFGPHNAFLTREGAKFCDFEYFGIDHSLKFIADFIHHPQIPYDQQAKYFFCKNLTTKLSIEKDFEKLFDIVIDLIGLEWILIILNVFDHKVLERKHSFSDRAEKEIFDKRLERARERLLSYKKNSEEHVTYFTFSERMTTNEL